MDEREDLCGVLGPGGGRCDMAAGHGGKSHAFEIPIPSEMGMFIDQYMTQLEEEKKKWRRSRHWNNVAFLAMIIAFVANVVAAVTQVF